MRREPQDQGRKGNETEKPEDQEEEGMKEESNKR